MNTIQLLDKLKSDLSLLEWFSDDIEVIKASHLAEIKALQPKPKKAPPVKPRVKESILRLTVTENGKTNVLELAEKEADKYLLLIQKTRAKNNKHPEGLSPPYFDVYGGNRTEKIAEYKQKTAKYWRAAENENLTFKVQIERL